MCSICEFKRSGSAPDHPGALTTFDRATDQQRQIDVLKVILAGFGVHVAAKPAGRVRLSTAIAFMAGPPETAWSMAEQRLGRCVDPLDPRILTLA